MRKLIQKIKTKLGFKIENKRLYPENKKLENTHQNQRCFIIGTGTSILLQDLKLLKNEHCIAMSQLYHHDDYSAINPEYHIFSGIKHHGFSDKIGIEYYQEINQKIAPTTKFFINYTDKELIEKNNLLIGREIYYCEFTQDLKNLEKNGFIADEALYASQSISIMAIQMALIMGFKEIYLVGLDHDWIIKAFNKEPCSFYDPSKTVFGKNGYVENYGEQGYCIEREFYLQAYLFKSYRLIKEYLTKIKSEIKIYNATKGGLIDVFERVEYEKVFATITTN